MFLKRLCLVSILAIIAIALSACSDNDPKPSDAFSTFTKEWNKQDFKKMYAQLSDTSKKAITEKKFTQRYKDIYDGIEAKNLKVTFDKPEKEKDPDDISSETFKYHVKMNTVAGPLSYSGKTSVVKKKKDDSYTWTVDWDPTMILKDLQMDQLVSVTTLESKRGEIVDRNEQGLAINGVADEIGLFPQQLEGHEENKTKLAKLLGVSDDDINDALSASWVTPDSFVPIKTVPQSETKIIDEANQLTGVVIKETPARVYPCGMACSHLTGYVGSVTKEDLDKYKDKGYTESSEIGKTGLELIYEDQLHGQDGAEITITDSDHQPIKTIAKKDPVDGKDLKLTIDTKVQKTLYNHMDGDSGAASAINPKTGEVLALVSTPAFDPNQFVLGISNSDYQKLLKDPEKPLLNRFTQTYAPGSTQKPISAAIALKNKVITPKTTLKINGLTWKDPSWKGDFHITREDSLPSVDLEKALVVSDNIYFAQVALKTGADKFVDGMKAFGFGEKLPFPYAMEASQVSNNGKIDSEGLLANTAYGQGEVLTNPLHLALVYSAFVNDGNIIKPQLLVTDDDSKPSYMKKNVVSASDAKEISKALSEGVETPSGTAYQPQIEGTPALAGKTGTAEHKEKQGTQGKDDGWFVAYNTDNPRLLISMMIENVQDKKSNLKGSHYVVDKVKRSFRELLK
ncbi:penicillin-binding protein [Pullulanibacillus pueri]|uniref:Penicillin-binding protein 3 n=1 Tax=Pullulanibacillus pueri TaxID=1437324 RepID=A0A8J3EN61_9BACL|nr:penicillin-binding transpeptidase domain-containing protein [Pullulanibacillus pueri]MBM7683213.1 penicillin-binding protein [Pullulanibacillus pueri]GGH85558.1 penicillin-binding protein 3 [Pullulanibacillus pueri]